ncbi:unnamed protein product [Amoebophrya sp. A25]|nr:unnamed protein product [Amoebophrya sp. A25]|eukprot:GSA25T00021626001.1
MLSDGKLALVPGGDGAAAATTAVETKPLEDADSNRRAGDAPAGADAIASDTGDKTAAAGLETAPSGPTTVDAVEDVTMGDAAAANSGKPSAGTVIAPNSSDGAAASDALEDIEMKAAPESSSVAAPDQAAAEVVSSEATAPAGLAISLPASGGAATAPSAVGATAPVSPPEAKGADTTATTAFPAEAEDPYLGLDDDDDDEDDEDEENENPITLQADDEAELDTTVQPYSQFPRRAAAAWPPPVLKSAKVMRVNPFDEPRAEKMEFLGRWRVVSQSEAEGEYDPLAEVPASKSSPSSARPQYQKDAAASSPTTASGIKMNINSKINSSRPGPQFSSVSVHDRKGPFFNNSVRDIPSGDKGMETMTARIESQFPAIRFLKLSTLQEKLKLLMTLLQEKKVQPKLLITALWGTLKSDEQTHVAKNLPDLAKYATVKPRPRKREQASPPGGAEPASKLQKTASTGPLGATAASVKNIGGGAATSGGATSSTGAFPNGIKQGQGGSSPSGAPQAKAGAAAKAASSAATTFVVSDQAVTALRVSNLPVGVKAQELGSVFHNYQVLGVNIKKSKKGDRYVGFVRVGNRAQATLATKTEIKFRDLVLKIAIDEDQTRIAQMQKQQAPGAPVGSPVTGVAKAAPPPSPPAGRPQFKDKRTRDVEVWADRVRYDGGMLTVQMSELGIDDSVLAEWCAWFPKRLADLEKLHKGNIKMAELDFSNNKIKDDGLAALVGLFRKHEVSIKNLSMGQNELTDQSLRALGEYILANSETLAVLSLEKNHFTSRGLVYLARKVKMSNFYPKLDKTFFKYQSLCIEVQGNGGLDTNELFALLAESDISYCQLEREAKNGTKRACPLLYLPGLNFGVDDDVSSALGPEMLATVFGKEAAAGGPPGIPPTMPPPPAVSASSSGGTSVHGSGNSTHGTGGGHNGSNHGGAGSSSGGGYHGSHNSYNNASSGGAGEGSSSGRGESSWGKGSGKGTYGGSGHHHHYYSHGHGGPYHHSSWGGGWGKGSDSWGKSSSNWAASSGKGKGRTVRITDQKGGGKKY